MEKCGTVVPQSNFQKREKRPRIDCNTRICNNLITSERIAEYYSKVRSWAVLQTAHSLITIRSIESIEHSIAARALRRSSIAQSSFAPLLFARSFFARSSFAPSLFARRLPALYLAAHRKFNRLDRTFLSPTLPPLAPVRPRPYAEAPGRDRPDSSLPPSPPSGGKITLRNQSTRIAEYCSRVRSRELVSAPLHFAPPRARSLITIRSIESMEHSIAARALRRSSIARSSFAPLLFARSFFARSSYAPCLFARRLHALYLAAHRKFNTLQNRTHERIDIKTNCRAPQPGRGGPVPPLAPCLRRSARARCALISLIINRLSNFRAPYEGGASGPPPPNAPPSYVARIGSYIII